jgi:hypothetical protein
MNQGILALLCLLLASAGCPFMSTLGGVRSDDISEIHMKMQTGLAGASADFVLRRDGSAIAICCKRFKSSRDSFAKAKNSYGDDYIRSISKSTVSEEQFSRLADLVVRNGYFSMQDSYEVPGLMDAPPTITRVVHSSGEKKISNQAGKGGPKLDEIQKTIYTLLNDLDWQ